jgi:signal transduction histidine kinase
VRQETTGGDDREPRITAEMVEDWLRHARLRATNLFYLADDPTPGHRDRALREMTQALREALEEVRVVAEELRRTGTTDNVIKRAR